MTGGSRRATRPSTSRRRGWSAIVTERGVHKPTFTELATRRLRRTSSSRSVARCIPRAAPAAALRGVRLYGRGALRACRDALKRSRRRSARAAARRRPGRSSAAASAAAGGSPSRPRGPQSSTTGARARSWPRGRSAGSACSRTRRPSRLRDASATAGRRARLRSARRRADAQARPRPGTAARARPRRALGTAVGDVLRRRRRASRQRGLSRTERRRNVAGAFRARATGRCRSPCASSTTSTRRRDRVGRRFGAARGRRPHDPRRHARPDGAPRVNLSWPHDETRAASLHCAPRCVVLSRARSLRLRTLPAS